MKETKKSENERQVDRITALYRRNHLETLKSLIEDGVISENDRVGDVVYKLEKSWKIE